jgi:GlpG protein
MRLIGELPTGNQANTFAAWLLTLSIETHFDEAGESTFEIWVKDEDEFQRAMGELSEFKQNPDAEKYRNAHKDAKRIADERLAKAKQHQKNIQRGIPNNKKGWFETSPLTVTLVVICAVVAIFSNFGDVSEADQWVARALQFVSVDAPGEELKAAAKLSPDSMQVRLASIFRGELWRLVSPIFVHYGAFHIIFNMLWLVQLGRMIEMRYGTLRLGMIVIFTAIFSNVLQSIVPIGVGGSGPFLINDLLITRFGGMSGVVYGLFGFIWLRMLYDPNARMYLSQMTVVLMIGYLFYCMVSPTIGGIEGSGRVANWAHGGGIVMGMLLALSPLGKTFGRPKPKS